MFAVFSVFALSAAIKPTVPVVSVRVTVSALTVPPKVVPPDCVTVSVPMSVPTAPPTVTAPVALKVRLDLVPPFVPLMLPVSMVLPCRVNVLPSAITIWPVETVAPLIASAVPCACSAPVVTMPDAVSAPLRFVVPTALVVMLAALTFTRLACAAEEIAKAPMAPLLAPMAPLARTTPALPAAIDTICGAALLALSTVPAKLTAAPVPTTPPLVVSTVRLSPSTTLPAKSMAPPALT